MMTCYKLTTFKVSLACEPPLGNSICSPETALPVLRAIYDGLDADQEHLVALILDHGSIELLDHIILTPNNGPWKSLRAEMGPDW